MLSEEIVNKYNNELLSRLSIFLNNNSTYINKNMIESLVKEYNITDEEAYKYLLCESLNINIEDNRWLFDNYFNKMIKKLDINYYMNNPYNKDIKIDNIDYKKYSFKRQKYEPYEAFVYNDLVKESDGRLIPQIGFFDKEYYYSSILESNREWMLITPNEIETMKEPINEAYGKVLTYGLGLGYYAYMVSLKEEVKEITIVEKDKDIIELFNKYILNQFKYKSKIKIVCEDAFEYSKKEEFDYDYVFIDIWHDPSDGIDLYLKFKELERKNINYSYWIEKTIKCYLD